MLDLLSHLIPDFHALFSTRATIGISAAFWLLMYGIFALSLIFLALHVMRCNARLRALASLLEDQTKETLAQSRRDTLQRALTLDPPDAGYLWREFDESLVVTGDQKKLFNTLDAEHFFNARTLASGLTGSRLLAAAPSLLVAIGVLGTFVGLTIGLANLNLASDADVDALREGIYILIQSAAVAFMTSVWGVGFSLLLNFVEKMFERNVLRRIRRLQQRIDFLYPRIPAEQSLVHIAEHTRESQAALQELHERIGDRLQEAMTGMNEAMQEALTETLNSIMGPAIQALVSNTSQQSTQALESLVGKFMEGMNSAGREQGELMQKAAADVNGAVSGMTEQLNELFTTLRSERERQREAADQQSSNLESQLARISSGADERQQQLETRFSDLMTRLGTQLDGQLEAAERRDQARGAAFEQTLAASEKRQRELLDKATQATSEQLRSFMEAGTSQQRHIEESMKQMLANLHDQMTRQSVGADQREQERQRRASEQLSEMSEQQRGLLASIAEGVRTTQEQGQQMAAQYRQLLEELRRATEAASASSKHMDSSANQLGVLSTNVRGAAGLLGERLESVTQRIEAAGGQNAELANQLKAHSETLSQLQTALLAAADRFEQAAAQARAGFGEMKSHQQEYLSAVRSEFTSLGEALSSQIERVERQAEEWLKSYSVEVERQVDHRMDQWNEKTRSFSDQMLGAVNAIGNIVDELESR